MRHFTELLLETCLDCLYVYDLDACRSLYRSRKLHASLGYTDSELECPDAVIPQQLLHAEDRLDAANLMASMRSLRHGEQSLVDFRMLDKTGRWRHFQSRITPLATGDDGRTTQILGMITDVSQQRWAEAEAREAKLAAEQASAAKSQFLAQMSHEIRTPLGGIIGTASLLLTTEMTAEQREYTEALSRSADALMSIVDDVLDYSKIEAGRLELKVRPFSPLDVIEQAMQAVAERAAAKGLAFYLKGAGSLPVELLGDGVRIRQILINLLSNAVKFTAAGEVRVEVRAAPTGEDGPWRLLVSVVDTGIGLTPEETATLFRKYQQTAATEHGGTGLGLAICKLLAELMGGQVGCSSAPGKGSRFWLELRLDGPKTQRERASAQDRLAGKKALIVSDYAASGEILRETLTEWGALAELRLVGKESRPGEAWQNPAHDVVIFDCQHSDSPVMALFQEAKAGILCAPLNGHFHTACARQAASSACLPQPASYRRLLAHVSGSKEARPETKSHLAAAAVAAAASESILVVDDNADNRFMLARMLEKAGFRYRMAVSGPEALAFIRTAVPDLILMDCQMPGMTGMQATQWLRAHAEYQQIPVIALTANVLGSTRAECLEAGMNDVLAKPIRLAELKDYLTRWLRPDERGQAQ